MTTNLVLDARQRAMLAEMGVRVWLPSDTAPTPAPAPTLTQVKPIAAPVLSEPPLRLPVLERPPASSAVTHYAIGNMPTERVHYDCVVIGEPCTGDAEKLLANITRLLGKNVFVAQMVTSTSDAVQLSDQLKSLPTKVMLALGPQSAKALLDDALQSTPFAKLRGSLHHSDKISSPIAVTYHPLQLLRRPLAKAQVWIDLKLAMQVIA